MAKKHQSVIYTLNAKMSEKAEAQIKVNETNDTLAGVNEHVQEMEEAILVVKEQIVKEKAEARVKRDLLVKEKIETLKLAREQEMANETKKKDVDILKSDLNETEKTLRIIYRENEKLDGKQKKRGQC